MHAGSQNPGVISELGKLFEIVYENTFVVPRNARHTTKFQLLPNPFCFKK